jgi:hypothetical protein
MNNIYITATVGTSSNSVGTLWVLLERLFFVFFLIFFVGTAKTMFQLKTKNVFI